MNDIDNTANTDIHTFFVGNDLMPRHYPSSTLGQQIGLVEFHRAKIIVADMKSAGVISAAGEYNLGHFNTPICVGAFQ